MILSFGGPALHMVLHLGLIAAMLLGQAGGQSGNRAAIPTEASQLPKLLNEARAEAGASPLQWDTALAEAARQHCVRMAADGSAGHQYPGEPSLAERAGEAGAHFSAVAESVAIGATVSAIDREWMDSTGDRPHLLDPRMDRVGVAAIASGGMLYAVLEVERSVPALTQTQVEAAVGGLLRGSGLEILRDPAAARAACAVDKKLFHTETGPQPGFVYRWQEPDMTHLPEMLLRLVKTPQYSQAAVGSCPAQDVNGGFTTYRVAVILYP